MIGGFEPVTYNRLPTKMLGYHLMCKRKGQRFSSGDAEKREGAPVPRSKVSRPMSERTVEISYV